MGKIMNRTAGAKLTWEYEVDVGAYSSLIPGNSTRKELDCWMNDQPVGNPKRKV
jgi:hypothetical protein